MNWRHLARGLAVAAGLVSAWPAWGCLNDREVMRAEGEFRSAYLKDPAPTSPMRSNTPGWIAVGAGAGMAVVAIALASRTRGVLARG